MARIDRLLAERAASLRAELERRLSTPGEDQSGPAGPLHGRSVALGRALDQLSLDVSALGMRLPALDQELERITAGAGQMSDDLARAGSQIDALEAATPELTAWLAQQKGELEQGVQSGRDALGGITARVQQLAGEVDRSRGLLVELNQSLVEGLEQARVDGNALRTAVDEMRVTGLEVAKLMEGAEDKVEAAHQAMQAKIDQMLSDLSEQADLAVLRAGDVGRRAEGEVVRRVDVAGAAALDAVAKERAAKLAALAEQVTASQRELEQTRAGLLESWQRMDQSVSQRQSEVLTNLDGYAGTIGVRVEELLQALDVMVAGSGG
jgi:chromosome segregation ATPase